MRRRWARNAGALAVLTIIAAGGPATAAEDPLRSMQQLFQGLTGRQDSAQPAQPSPARNLQQRDAPAAASTAIAWVDDISGVAKPEVDIADTLEAGQVIALGAKGKAVIGYFADCRVETITGGTVTIAAGGSQVSGGKMSVGKMACSGAPAVIAANASEAAAAAKRVTPFANDPWTEQALKVATPLIRWQASGKTAQVRVLEVDAATPRLVWQATVSDDRTPYKGPPLAIGMPYAVEVSGAGATQRALFSIDPGLAGDDALRRTVVVRR